MTGQIIGIIIALVAAILIGQDASKRGMNAWGWGIGVFLLLIVFLPLYFILRKPKVDSFHLPEAKPEAKAEECTVIEEKMIVYAKSHESMGILTELEIGTKLVIDFKSDFGRFYKVRLTDGQEGFILKISKYQRTNS
jgi:MFS family permease